MNFVKGMFLVLLICILPYVDLAKARLSTEHLVPQTAADKKTKSLLVESRSLELTTQLVYEQFKLTNPLKIIAGANDGPLFDPINFEILLLHRNQRCRNFSRKNAEHRIEDYDIVTVSGMKLLEPHFK